MTKTFGRGLTDVADWYGGELLRIYDHYRFRWHASLKSKPTETRPQTRARPPADVVPR